MSTKINWSKFFRLLSVPAIGLTLISCLVIYAATYMYSGIDIFADPIGDNLRTVATEKALWAAQHINHYRLVAEIESFGGPACQQDVDVYNEHVVYFYENTCQLQGVTVSSLFAQIDFYAQQIRWVNDQCDFLAVHPSYDSDRGFPRTINIHQDFASPSNIGGSIWLELHPLGRLSSSACTLLGRDVPSITIQSVSPLPDMIF